MKAYRTLFKNSIVALSCIICLAFADKTIAGSYVFDWYDSGQEWYFMPDSPDLTTVKAEKWQGHFTLPESAVVYGNENADYQFVSLDLTKYLDFSLTGKLLSGRYMEANAFHGDSGAITQAKNSKDIKINTGIEFSFAMLDPAWRITPLYLNKTDQDHWLVYNDWILDANTNSLVCASISHDGMFVGHYVDDLNHSPVPEPATIILLGAGTVGLFASRMRKKMLRLE